MTPPVSARRLALAFLLALAAVPAAVAAGLPPAALAGLDFVQHPGARLPADVVLRDAAGRPVRTGDLFARGTPLVLAFEYFRCTTLCGVVLGDLAEALRRVPMEPGADYAVMAVSIDPGDTPADAATLQARHFARDPRFAAAVHALVGGPEGAAGVRRLAEAAGFPFRRDPESGQYAHPAGVLLLAPGGVVARTVLGVGYDPMDLRLGLAEAGRGTIASVADRLLLLCYGYDPARGQYNAAVGTLVKATGAVSVLALGLLIARAARPGGRRGGKG